MIRSAEIQNKLLHLVGWKQNYDTTKLKISEDLTTSESGLYFQQAHPLLTLQNLSCVAPDFTNISFAEHSLGAEYEEGNIVMRENKLYKCLKKHTDKQLTDTSYWKETDLFSDWVEDKTKASIQKAISRFYTEKINKGTYAPLCENRALFDGAGRIVDTVKNRNNVVGLEIIPARSKGVTIKINKIALQFTELGKYQIYVMHSSSAEPYKIITLEKKKKNSIEWFNIPDLYLPYQTDITDAGGSWYICYLQSELPTNSEAIRKDRDWSKGPCNACSRHEYEAFKVWSKYIEVHPFYIHQDNALTNEGIELWDIENNMYDYNNNFGLNLDISIECDLTDFIVEQRMLFQDIIIKQVAVDMLREFAYNPSVRTNRHSINASRIDILNEIDGDAAAIKKSGLSYELEKAFNAISLSTEGLDRVCMPCKNNGINYRVI